MRYKGLGFIKTAFLGWGGRKKDYGEGKVQASIGYSNLLGVIPYPTAGIRIGLGMVKELHWDQV